MRYTLSKNQIQMLLDGEDLRLNHLHIGLRSDDPMRDSLQAYVDHQKLRDSYKIVLYFEKDNPHGAPRIRVESKNQKESVNEK